MSPGRVRCRRRWGTFTLATLLAALIAAAPAEARRHRKSVEESYDPAYASIVVDPSEAVIVSFVVLILTLLFRPTGLFATPK